MQLEIRNVSKTYLNGVRALYDISLTLPRGMYVLLGPNGAGKSTLMRETLGYLPQEFGIMVTTRVIAAACVLMACGPVPDNAPRSSAPRVPASRTYAVRDSAEWDCYGNGGYFGALYDGDNFIDTVDLSAGFTPVPGGVIFTPMRPDPGVGVDRGCPQEPVLSEQGRRRPVRELLPLFDGGLPAMTSDSGTLMYWGIDGERVYAMRYAWRTRRLDSTLVSADPSLLATDNRFQLEPPVRAGSEYRFPTASGLQFVLDRQWQVVRVDSSAR